jgi:8-oxo-dGTP pyrophosphatase MutT (NUDIX family)
MRELSAGGVVVRRMQGRSWVAAIRPHGRPRGHWALPKGLVDPGERAVETAVREVREETGLEARVVRKLDDMRYVYTRDGRRIFKVVLYWLMHPVGGRLGAIDEAMRIEVEEARWLPLEDAPAALAYRSERALVATLLGNEAQVAV